MTTASTTTARQRIETPSGRIGYREQGTGPVALFVHGVLLNGYLWRHQLAELRTSAAASRRPAGARRHRDRGRAGRVGRPPTRRCCVSSSTRWRSTQVDLVGNDSGGGIALIFAATYPQRVRTLTLTDCDAHDNWPPEAFKPFLAMAAGWRSAGDARRRCSPTRTSSARRRRSARPTSIRSRSATRPSTPICAPLLRTAERTRDLERFLAAFDCAHTRGGRGAA